MYKFRIRIAAYRASDQSSTHLSESCESSTLELPAVLRLGRDPSEDCLQNSSPMYGVLLEPTCCTNRVAVCMCTGKKDICLFKHELGF